MKALLITLALSGICHGRIGETLEQCAQRYGEVTQRIEPSRYLPTRHVFNWNDIRVVVILNDDGKCMLASYTTKPGTPLSAAQVKEFLALSRGVGNWKCKDQRSMPNPARSRTWENSKQGSHAELTVENGQSRRLCIFTEEYRKRLRDLDWDIRHARKK